MYSALFFAFLFCFLEESNSKNIGLYSTDDDVVILTNKNFYQTILGADNAWIIEFYNSWCGHCIHFASTWKQLSTDVKGWQKVISVAAIDCSALENARICGQYDIEGYPDFKLFPPYSDKNDSGEDFHEQEKTLIKNKLIDYVSSDSVKQRAKHWPDLDILSSVEKIWEVAEDEHKYVTVIFEHQESVIGREVILDMCDYKQVLVRRVSSKHVSKYGIKHFPSLYVIHRDGIYQRIAKNVNDREGFTTALLELIGAVPVIHKGIFKQLDEMKVKPDAEDQMVKPGINNTALQISSNPGSVLYMQDLESALSYSLRQEIAIRKTISDDALEALRKFIQILAKYFPGKEEIKTFLWRVSTWLESLTADITGLEWAEKIDSLQSEDSHLPDRNWKSCAGSQPRYRGYPCGMWMLFHSLTVNAYLSGKRNKKVDPTEVLLSVNGYMKHFFGCQECSKNFGKMAKTIESEITSHRDSVLWLWRAHNRANKRLHGDPSEDPKYPKIQFPSKKMCPECFFDDKDPNDLKWNSRQVFKFLLNLYQKNNILSYPQDIDSENITNKELDWWELKQRKKDLEKIQQIRSQKRQKLQAKYQKPNKKDNIGKSVKENKPYFKVSVKGWGFNDVDFGMCVIFYFLCTTIIVVLYYHFIVRRRYKPPCKLLPF